MKNIIMLAMLLIGLETSSCKKCYQCTNALGEDIGQCCEPGSNCNEMRNEVIANGGTCD